MFELYGSKIRQRRKELGLKLHQVAERAGLSCAIVSIYERNMISGPSLITVRRLEAALGVEKGTFFS